MDDPGPVCRFERPGDLDGDGDRVRRFHAALRSATVGHRTLAEIHHQDGTPVGRHLRAVEGHDVGMDAQRLEDRGFPEQGFEVGGRDLPDVEQLEGHRPSGF
jgi:hypothetical protein